MSDLPAIADESIRRGLLEGRPWSPDLAQLAAEHRRPGASFVSLHRQGTLLGCIGSLEARRPLAHDVAANAWAAAFADPRLPAVQVVDYEEMEISVSVLSPLAALPAPDRETLRRTLRPGVDGLVVEAGGRRATFLPSVWSQLPDREEFLDALWQKAGWSPREWPRGIRCARYSVREELSRGPRRFARTS